MTLLQSLLNLGLDITGQLIETVEQAQIAFKELRDVSDDLGSDTAPVGGFLSTGGPESVTRTLTSACSSRMISR